MPSINQIHRLGAAVAPANKQELTVPQQLVEAEDFVEGLLV